MAARRPDERTRAPVSQRATLRRGAPGSRSPGATAATKGAPPRQRAATTGPRCASALPHRGASPSPGRPRARRLSAATASHRGCPATRAPRPDWRRHPSLTAPLNCQFQAEDRIACASTDAHHFVNLQLNESHRRCPLFPNRESIGNSIWIRSD